MDECGERHRIGIGIGIGIEWIEKRVISLEGIRGERENLLDMVCFRALES